MTTDRARVRRLPARASYERDALYAVLDEGLVCHLGFVDAGQPYVIPTSYGREGDALYIHGARTSRMLNVIPDTTVCVTVTLLDGLVLARSAFHHSMNYRSAVVFGRAELVEDEAARMHALEVISERIVPGRWPEVRGPNTAEMKATTVVRIPIEEFSVKSRSGAPGDDTEDMALPVWAGVLPIETKFADPVPDEGAHSVDLPEHIRRILRERL